MQIRFFRSFKMQNSAKQKQTETLHELNGNRQKKISDFHTILDDFIEDKIISKILYLNALPFTGLKKLKSLETFKKVIEKQFSFKTFKYESTIEDGQPTCPPFPGSKKQIFNEITMRFRDEAHF